MIMKRTFDTETIRLMILFENITHVPVMDCVVNEKSNTICFVIGDGNLGMAIGKNGNSVKRAEKMIGKNIRLFEFSKDLGTFVKRLIPQTTDLTIKKKGGETIVEVRIQRRDRAFVIGRDGKNLKIYKELLKRSHQVSDLVVV